jgi:transcriptional regulator with XRE-family HTH domain
MYIVTNGNIIIFTFVILIYLVMKERLQEFLRAENKTSAQLAEEIGVQASGISHILSGRNNPSLDFVLKMLKKYKYISTDWLLFGKGSMYKDSIVQNLFDNEISSGRDKGPVIVKSELNSLELETEINSRLESRQDSDIQSKIQQTSIKKIVWFYDNNSFEEFFPHK